MLCNAHTSIKGWWLACPPHVCMFYAFCPFTERCVQGQHRGECSSPPGGVSVDV